MAEDANEDSWLYGTSNPDSTTNEEDRVAGVDGTIRQLQIKMEFENEAAALTETPKSLENSNDTNVIETIPGGDGHGYGEFDDPAQEMEEDEEATAAADTTDATGEHETDAADRDQLKSSGASADSEEDEEDDSDDDINVVIGDIKAAPSTYNIKQRSNLLAGGSSAGQEKQKTAQAGKFSIEEFESVGTINGVPAHEFSIDSLDEKPWRKPGADITDYFNYGFNEETWRAYCERQKRFRVVESGVGLASLTANLNQSNERHHHDNIQGGGVMGSTTSSGGPISALGNIDIHQMPPSVSTQSHHQQRPLLGSRGPRPSGMSSGPNTKENAIQVMTAECREYSRTGGMSQIPPNFGPPVQLEEPFFPEADPFDYGYEPTQESQWMNDNPGWVPTGIKELTPGPTMGPPVNPVPGMPPPGMAGPPGVPPPQMGGPPGIPSPLVSGPGIRGPSMMGPMPPNLAMGPPPPIGMMMGPGTVGPPMRMPMGPPRMMGPPSHSPLMERERHERERDRNERERERDRDRERDRERDRDRDRERREDRDRERERDRERDRDRDYERGERRERDRDRERERDRERDNERDRSEREKGDKGEDAERTDEDRERRRRDRDRDRERERTRRDRSRSREKSSRRRSKSREKEREKERDKEREKEREKDREKDRESDKDREKDRHKDRESRSSKSSRSEKKKHRKDKEEEE